MAFAVPIFSEGFGFFVCFLQSWPRQDLLSRYVLGLAMLMFPPLRRYHHNLRLTDDLTVLARIEIVAILVHYQPCYYFSHTHNESKWPTKLNSSNSKFQIREWQKSSADGLFIEIIFVAMVSIRNPDLFIFQKHCLGNLFISSKPLCT